MKVLVLTTFYPGDGSGEAHRFVHVRNLYYKKVGVDLKVLCFEAKKSYEYEGIQVITIKDYLKNADKYDILISHQANIRQHYIFLRKYGSRFDRYILFFHGHEVLRFKTTYPEPYNYVGKTYIKRELRDVYDKFKLSIWHNFIPKIIDKSMLVFVSNWMLEEFLASTKLSIEDLKGNYRITYNCVGDAFQKNTYDYRSEKTYDFITIRNNLDGSKYCIDIVNELAKRNTKSKFLIIGKGSFYKYYEKPQNVEWRDCTLNHDQIINALNEARCALMPTRTDAQGLMMCEMATFGMPVITSELPVCHEALDSFENVRLISNDTYNIDLEAALKEMESKEPFEKNSKYYNSNTSQNEVDMLYAFEKEYSH